MLPDYQANSVYVSLWLQKDYKEVYTNLITILSKYNINHQVMRVCQNTLLITEDRYIAELSYEVAI